MNRIMHIVTTILLLSTSTFSWNKMPRPCNQPETSKELLSYCTMIGFSLIAEYTDSALIDLCKTTENRSFYQKRFPDITKRINKIQNEDVKDFVNDNTFIFFDKPFFISMLKNANSLKSIADGKLDGIEKELRAKALSRIEDTTYLAKTIRTCKDRFIRETAREHLHVLTSGFTAKENSFYQYCVSGQTIFDTIDITYKRLHISDSLKKRHVTDSLFAIIDTFSRYPWGTDTTCFITEFLATQDPEIHFSIVAANIPNGGNHTSERFKKFLAFALKNDSSDIFRMHMFCNEYYSNENVAAKLLCDTSIHDETIFCVASRIKNDSLRLWLINHVDNERIREILITKVQCIDSLFSWYPKIRSVNVRRYFLGKCTDTALILKAIIGEKNAGLIKFGAIRIQIIKDHSDKPMYSCLDSAALNNNRMQKLSASKKDIVAIFTYLKNFLECKQISGYVFLPDSLQIATADTVIRERDFFKGPFKNYPYPPFCLHNGSYKIITLQDTALTIAVSAFISTMTTKDKQDSIATILNAKECFDGYYPINTVYISQIVFNKSKTEACVTVRTSNSSTYYYLKKTTRDWKYVDEVDGWLYD